MYTARLIIVFVLILTAVVAYNPLTQEQAKEGWAHVRPAVVAFMDGMYAVVRTLIAGDGNDDWIDDHPISPGGDFDRIVTLSSALPL